MSKGLKIEHDKYYTPYHVVKEVVNTVKGLDLPISNIIEPSAGNGAFIEALSNAFPTTEVDYYDLHPEHNLIKEQDFLTLDIPYQKDRLIIGNPPFGNRNSLSVKFYKKAITLGDYIAFILPISQLDNTKQMYEFDLIYSKDLGANKYSDADLHCCFNIYKRPENGLNGKPKAPTIEGLTVVEYRRDKEDSYRKKVKDGYFHSIGSWGNGSVGIAPKHIGYYSMELYFYSDNQKIIDVVMSIDWKDEVKSISSKKLPKGLALEIIQSKLSIVMGDFKMSDWLDYIAIDFKAKSIHKAIIELKQENRNIGDKIKSLYRNISTNALKLIDGSETAGYTYNDRVMRDHTTIDYLEKLQMINSMLINQHRSKAKALRSELQELKISLDNLNRYIS